MEDLQKLAYDAVKARLEDGEDELISLEMTERRLRGEAARRIWREYGKLAQEQLAKASRYPERSSPRLRPSARPGPSVHGKS